jgi:hypothetical protein
LYDDDDSGDNEPDDDGGDDGDEPENVGGSEDDEPDDGGSEDDEPDDGDDESEGGIGEDDDDESDNGEGDFGALRLVVQRVANERRRSEGWVNAVVLKLNEVDVLTLRGLLLDSGAINPRLRGQGHTMLHVTTLRSLLEYAYDSVRGGGRV